MYYADFRNRVTPIPTPPVVRAVAAGCVAASISVMAAPLPAAVKVGVALAAVLIARATTRAHPYRKAMAEFARSRNVSQVPSLSMVVPLMLWWLAIMLCPLISPLPGWGLALLAGGLFVVAWVLMPHVDGTRRLAYAPAAPAAPTQKR